MWSLTIIPINYQEAIKGSYFDAEKRAKEILRGLKSIALQGSFEVVVENESASKHFKITF